MAGIRGQVVSNDGRARDGMQPSSQSGLKEFSCYRIIMTFQPFSRIEEPFTIGLQPVDPNGFLFIDDRLTDYRAQKRVLYEQLFDECCMAEPTTAEAQREGGRLIVDCLRNHHTQHYRFDAGHAYPTDGSAPIDLHSRDEIPLATTALLVPDDLVLMRRDDSGWRMVAASLCFPSSWNPREKFGKSLEAIHAPVPMGEQTNSRIRRIFDGLKPGIPVWRENWALDADDELRHALGETDRAQGMNKLAGEIFLRTEYQTLHKLPVCGDILFTIGIYITPLESLLDTDNGHQKVSTLLHQYRTMSDAGRSYKGIDQNSDGLVNWLEKNKAQNK